MKSKAKIPLEFGQKPVEYFKNSSFNFLENERLSHAVVQQGNVDQKADTYVNEAQNTKVEEKPQEQSIVSSVVEERTVASSYGPKKYVTTCHFQPKQKPVYYSETMIVNIGSKNKKYFESIYYETKVVPFRWTETMTAIIPDQKPVLIKSDINVPIEKPAFHYISLQQPVK